MMTERGLRIGQRLRTAIAGLHGGALLLALAVPAYAIFDAAGAIAARSATEEVRPLIDTARWLALLGNTAVVCGAAVAVALSIGGLLGLLASRTNLPGRRLLIVAALFAACVPVYVSSVVFFSVVPAGNLNGSAVACGLLYGLVYAPLAGLLLGLAFRGADRELEDQALLDANPRTVLWRITVPQAGWGAAAAGVIVILLVATDITITDILAVRTFAEETFSQYQLDATRRAGPLLTSMPVLVALALLLLAVQTRLRHVGQRVGGDQGRRPRVFDLGRWRAPTGICCVLLTTVAVGVPAVLLWQRVKPLAGLWSAIVGLQRELYTSAGLAILGATAVVLPAGGLAWSTARGGRLGWVTSAGVLLLLALPAPVVGISLIALLNNSALGWIYDSALKVSVGYYVRFLPLGVLLLIPAVRRVPRELEWAARIDGCDWLGVHWHVRRPALMADAALAWLIVVILCFAEVGTTVLLVAPGWETASVRAFTLMHFGVYRDLALLALLSTASILLPWALLLMLLRRVRRRAL